MGPKIFENSLRVTIVRLFPKGQLRQAALYALFPGGKRLRPRLSFIVGKILGVPKNKLTILAAALEMIHNYTLIHDDLPAMDDDDFRRGKPTVHKKFGEATAILVGDALLTQAFELLSDLKSPELTRFIARLVGARGTILGQVLDMGTDTDFPGTDTRRVSVPNSRKSVSVPAFLKIYKLKTANLFEAAIVGPAYLKKTSPALRKRLSTFAQKFGLAFQIADDLADAQERHRKKAPTLATTLGPEKTKKLLQKLGSDLGPPTFWE